MVYWFLIPYGTDIPSATMAVFCPVTSFGRGIRSYDNTACVLHRRDIRVGPQAPGPGVCRLCVIRFPRPSFT